LESTLAHLLILFIREFGNDYLNQLLVPCIVNLKAKYPTENMQESIQLEMTEYFVQQVVESFSERMQDFPTPISQLFCAIRSVLCSENVPSETSVHLPTSFSDPDFFKLSRVNPMGPKAQSAIMSQESSNVADSIIASLFFLRIVGPSKLFFLIFSIGLSCRISNYRSWTIAHVSKNTIECQQNF
jgi:hypothetical protein